MASDVVTRTPMQHRANTRMLTYQPDWTKGMREILGHSAYHSGRGTETERVAYADQQTGYADCRTAVNIARGVPLDRINPAHGTGSITP